MLEQHLEGIDMQIKELGDTDILYQSIFQEKEKLIISLDYAVDIGDKVVKILNNLKESAENNQKRLDTLQQQRKSIVESV